MEWLTTFGTFVGVAGVLGGVFAAFYASRSKGIIELLKTENTAYKESNERLHQDNDNLRLSENAYAFWPTVALLRG